MSSQLLSHQAEMLCWTARYLPPRSRCGCDAPRVAAAAARWCGPVPGSWGRSLDCRTAGQRRLQQHHAVMATSPPRCSYLPTNPSKQLTTSHLTATICPWIPPNNQLSSLESLETINYLPLNPPNYFPHKIPLNKCHPYKNPSKQLISPL